MKRKNNINSIDKSVKFIVPNLHSYGVNDLALTAVGLFMTLARQSGARCQMNLEILTVLMAFNAS